ncbi:MAG: exosortase A [Rhodocyclaceae bacterium]|nr:exosortase A [Rhodocyclaceae bacterium]
MNAVPPVPTFASGRAPVPQGSPSVTPAFAWKQALAAIVLVELALIALYFETGRAMVDIWTHSETFNHAFLVPPITLWLIWEKRQALARAAPRPTLWLALPFVGLAFAWLLGDLAAINVVTQFAFVAMLVLAVPMMIGLPAAKRIAFPLGFLFFAVPFGEFAMPKLMDWTATFTVLGLRASGIPVFQEGLHFVIPSGRWSVVEACSGVRYLIASVVVGTLYAYINYQSLRRRLIFVGVAILVPLIANWVRAYLIVMLGHFSGNQIAVGVDHLIYGWVFFGVVIMIMFAIGMRWREPEAALPPPAPDVEYPAAGKLTAALLLAALLALGIALTPRAALIAMAAGPALPPPVLTAQALATGGWQGVETPLTGWQPAFANPSATLNATLTKDGRHVGVFIAYYQQQNYERKLISSENMLVTSSDKEWALVGRDVRQIALAGQSVTVRGGSLRSQLASIGAEPLRLKVWHWYWIDGQIIASDHLGKLRLALARLSGRGDASAAIFVYAPEPDGESALADYLAHAGGGIAAVLHGAVPPAPTLGAGGAPNNSPAPTFTK